MKSLKQSLGIDDTYTKLYRRPTKADEQTHVKDNVYLASGYNCMADILHLPTDSFGFNLTPPKGASPQTLVGTGPAGAEPREAASERTRTHEGYVWC